MNYLISNPTGDGEDSERRDKSVDQTTETFGVGYKL